MTKRRMKELFRPDYFYTMRTDPHGVVAGYRTDGMIERGNSDNAYYYNEKVGSWFAVDRGTGCSIAIGSTLDEVYDAVHSDEAIRKLENFKKTPKYTTLSSQFYTEMVRLGVYVENFVRQEAYS